MWQSFATNTDNRINYGPALENIVYNYAKSKGFDIRIVVHVACKDMVKEISKRCHSYYARKGRVLMTNTVFSYDHIMFRAEYRTPDLHSHLAMHFIVGLEGKIHCDVHGGSFDADAVFIASDVEHTAYAETGDMLVFLFDVAGNVAKEAERKYLCGKRVLRSICSRNQGKAVLCKLD